MTLATAPRLSDPPRIPGCATDHYAIAATGSNRVKAPSSSCPTRSRQPKLALTIAHRHVFGGPPSVRRYFTTASISCGDSFSLNAFMSFPAPFAITTRRESSERAARNA